MIFLVKCQLIYYNELYVWILFTLRLYGKYRIEKRGYIMKLNESILKGLLASLFVGAGIGFASSDVSAADINVIIPTERAIYQRDYDNTADMTVKAECEGAAKVKARVINGNTALCDWTELSKSDGDVFSGELPDVAAGGFYQVEFEAFDESGASVGDTNVERVGVGEVFITGGQSNSANFAEVKMSANNDYVSSLNAKTGEWVHCEDVQPNNSGYSGTGGSPWPAMGDKLADELELPIGFVCTGRGNTKISELGDVYYGTIKEALEAIKPYGCRAFLIHQGEADEGTDMTQYKADYEKLIQQTRDDIGYDLSWIVARVSYAWNGYNNKEKMELITSTQASLANNYNVFVGPTTDDMLDDYRSSIDHLHMSEKGLVEHGSRWADAVIKYFCTPYALKADSSMAHGKVNQCSESLYGGQKVTLTATADDGYYLVPGSFKVTNEDGAEIALDNDSFIMRAENGLTVSAQFAELPAYLKNLLTVINKGKSINTSLYPADKAADIAALNSAIAAGEKVIEAVGTEAEATKAAADIEAAMVKVGPLVHQATPTPAPTAAPSLTPDVTQAPVDTSAPDTIVKGYKHTKSGVVYKVTSTDKLTVSVVGLAKKSATSSVIVIPASVKISGKTYKVTAVEKNAFKNLPKLKKLTIKSTTITSVAKKAFVKVNAKVKVKVPAKKLKAYTKLLVKGGLKKKSICK